MFLSLFIIGLLCCFSLQELKLLILLEILLISSILVINSNMLDLLLTNILVLGSAETVIGLCLIIKLYNQC